MFLILATLVHGLLVYKNDVYKFWPLVSSAKLLISFILVALPSKWDSKVLGALQSV